MFEVAIDVWGEFACFTKTTAKVERVSYDVITPSAARNILNAIYCKPIEFWYEITQIEVMKPIKHIDIRCNEVYSKATDKQKSEPLYVEEIHTPRSTSFLKDVYYRIHAKVHVRKCGPGTSFNEAGIKTQFEKRVKKGKCFMQPYLGLSECMCFFSEPNEALKPIEASKDLGIMLYDIFDPSNNIPLNTDKKHKSGKTNVSFYHPYMINGIINVPAYGSSEIFKK